MRGAFLRPAGRGSAFFFRGTGRWVWPALAVLCHVAAAARAQPQPELEMLLQDRYAGLGGPLVYFHAAVDLDGDGRDETVVHVVGPMACGTGGCDTLVYTPTPEGYREVAHISVSRPPVQVSSDSTNGWRHLLVRVAGGGLRGSYDAELVFDGQRYPGNPTVPPARRAAGAAETEVLIPEFDSMAEGTPLATD